MEGTRAVWWQGSVQPPESPRFETTWSLVQIGLSQNRFLLMNVQAGNLLLIQYVDVAVTTFSISIVTQSAPL